MPFVSIANTARDPDQQHRPATTLELFFDLVAVVAVTAAATGLQSGIFDEHLGVSIARYLMIFFAIWWVWINYAWYASAYDNGDAIDIILAFVMMFGFLVMASGIHHFFDTGENGPGFIGWTIVRVGQIALWLRAAAGDPDRRKTALTYAIGLAVLQSLWILLFLLVPSGSLYKYSAILVVGELLLPIYAGSVPYHRGHFIERHGLMNIIVLGEGVFAAGLMLTASLKDDGFEFEHLYFILSAMAIVCLAWWIYFSEDEHRALNNTSSDFLWTYGHWIIYASGAAIGAGLAVIADSWNEDMKTGGTMQVIPVAVSVAIYLMAVWLLFERYGTRRYSSWLLPVAAIAVLASAYATHALWPVALVLAGTVAVKRVRPKA